MPLTAKQSEFCKQYIVDFNGSAAAIRAGYSEKGVNRAASRLLSNVDIQRECAKLMAARAERVEVTQDYVLSMLVKNAERAMQHEPVLDSEGNETGEYRYQGSVANKALELLGKHLGLFTEKLELKGELDHTIREINVNIRRGKES